VARGYPAVLLSLAGDRAPAADEPTSRATLNATGRTVLQTISALDRGPAVPAPSSYLSYHGDVIPGWAVRLLGLGLILPVLGATVDGLARARRRGDWVARWVVWVLSAALPFALGVVAVLAFRLFGLLGNAPAAPVAGGVPIHGGGVVLLAVLALLLAGGFAGLRPLVIRMAALQRGGSQEPGCPGAAAALMGVLCAVALVVWLANPFAALLLVPALHLWLWAVGPAERLPRGAIAVLALTGLAAPAAAVVFWCSALGLGPLGLVWNAAALLAGGSVGVLGALEASVVLGCAVSFAVIVMVRAREPRVEPVPVSVRGPASYAGPGSLGGTRSAIRR
jgi:hypothetical protein